MFFNSKEKKQKSSNLEILNNRFALKIPEDWKDKSVYKFDGPQDYGIKHNIFVHIENQVEIPDLQRYADKEDTGGRILIINYS